MTYKSLVVIVLTVLLLTSCGHRGDLYLPGHKPEKSKRF
ncbi:MAG: hypothetical protein K0R98_1744 [Rickettsiaceae bacterium]|jgi:predicted small lipoprotein YifL|nr:hypothetical protein [Rickettsiaceae bacterium]